MVKRTVVDMGRMTGSLGHTVVDMRMTGHTVPVKVVMSILERGMYKKKSD